MLRDEYKTLGLGQPAIALAKQALLFEEFDRRRTDTWWFSIAVSGWNSSSTGVYSDGHRHQKAIGAMKSVRRAPKTVPELEFSFIVIIMLRHGGHVWVGGQHVDYSHQMAQQSLVPVLQAAPDALVVSNGFGCAHQINGSATDIAFSDVITTGAGGISKNRPDGCRPVQNTLLE